MSTKINKALQFSQKYINGSPNKKRNLVSQYNDAVFERLLSHVDNNNILVIQARYDLECSLPERKRIDIKTLKAKENDKFYAYSDFIYNDKNTIIGQTIEMPLNRGKIKVHDIPTFLHELTHVLDTLINPKYNAKSNICEKRGVYQKKYNDFYDNVLYKKENYKNDTEKTEILKNCKNLIKNLLKGHTAREKLDCVQNMRYYLESEQNAYREQLKFAQKLQTKKMPVLNEDLVDYEPVYLFKEKLEMLKELGFEYVNTIRTKLHKHNSKTV